jgi:hypothetical protein
MKSSQEQLMNVQKVVLMGGFGESPALVAFLRAWIKQNMNNLPIDIICPEVP